MPESFITVEAVVKFVTMVIFTTSAQHAAVNSGQVDIFLFIRDIKPGGTRRTFLMVISTRSWSYPRCSLSGLKPIESLFQKNRTIDPMSAKGRNKDATR
jgi:hypothetical protein